MAQDEDRIFVSTLLDTACEIMDKSSIRSPEIKNAVRHQLAFPMSLPELDKALGYLKTEQGQKNLRSLRDKIDGLLDS